MDALNSRDPVEAAIKGQDLLYAMVLHDSYVECVPRGDIDMRQQNVFGTFRCCLFDGEHGVDNPEERIERLLNGVAAADRCVAVQNLLKYFGVTDQTGSCADKMLQQSLRVGLVRMRCAHEIHRDIGIDEDQDRRSWTE